MALTTRIEHASAALEVRHVYCRPHGLEAGATEENSGLTLVLPLRGVFRKHLGRNSHLIADETRGVFFVPGQPYRVSHLDTSGDECLALEFRARLLAGFEAEVAQLTAGRLASDGAPLPPRAQAVRNRLSRRLRAGAVSELEIEESATRLLESALAACFDRESARWRSGSGRVTSSARRRLVEQVLERFHADPGENLRLTELSRAVHSSPRQLTACFRDETGLSIHRYLVRLRLARALDELLDERRDVSAIGLALGFSTPSHFAASFRAAFGVAPTVLRGEDAAATMRRLREHLRESNARPISTAGQRAAP
jgi:AraC-like DNA-binding protein